MYEELAHLIKEKRLEKGISMRKLAILCGTNDTGLGKIESCKRDVSISVLKKICNHLDIYFDDCIYMLNLGCKYNTKNKYLIDTYKNISDEKLVIVYRGIKVKAKENNNRIMYLYNRLDTADNKALLKETIKSLEHENITNNYILKIIEEKIINNYINEH